MTGWGPQERKQRTCRREGSRCRSSKRGASVFTTNPGCGRGRPQQGGAWDRKHEGTGGGTAALGCRAGVRAEGVSLASPKAVERPRSWSCGPRGRPRTEGGGFPRLPPAACSTGRRSSSLLLRRLPLSHRGGLFSAPEGSRQPGPLTWLDHCSHLDGGRSRWCCCFVPTRCPQAPPPPASLCPLCHWDLLPLEALGTQAPPYTHPQSLAYLLPWRSLHVLLRLSPEWQLRTALICELAPPMSVPTRGCLPSPWSASGSLGFPVQALDDFNRNSRRLEGEAGAGRTYSRRASFLPLGLATALTHISGPLCVFQVP